MIAKLYHKQYKDMLPSSPAKCMSFFGTQPTFTPVWCARVSEEREQTHRRRSPYMFPRVPRCFLEERALHSRTEALLRRILLLPDWYVSACTPAIFGCEACIYAWKRHIGYGGRGAARIAKHVCSGHTLAAAIPPEPPPITTRSCSKPDMIKCK
jgi:hypothetical protein